MNGFTLLLFALIFFFSSDAFVVHLSCFASYAAVLILTLNTVRIFVYVSCFASHVFLCVRLCVRCAHLPVKYEQSLLVLVAPPSCSRCSILPPLQSQPRSTVFVWRGAEWAPSAEAATSAAATTCNAPGGANSDDESNGTTTSVGSVVAASSSSNWASLDPVVQWHFEQVGTLYVMFEAPIRWGVCVHLCASTMSSWTVPQVPGPLMAAVVDAAAAGPAAHSAATKEDEASATPLRGQSIRGVQWRMELDGSESDLFWEAFNYDDDDEDDEGDSR